MYQETFDSPWLSPGGFLISALGISRLEALAVGKARYEKLYSYSIFLLQA